VEQQFSRKNISHVSLGHTSLHGVEVVRLRSTQADRVAGTGSAPCGRPHKKLEPSEVILSSLMQRSWRFTLYWRHVDVHKGDGINGQSLWLSNFLLFFHYSIFLYEYTCSNVCKKRTTLEKRHNNPWNIHAAQDICLVIHACKITGQCWIKL